MHVRPLHYQAFLLRFWQEQSGEAPVWRFSLEDPSSGQRLGFADLAALTTFLLQRTSEGSGEWRAATGDQVAALMTIGM